MSEPSFFEQEEFDESKLKTALKESDAKNSKKMTFADDRALSLIGEEFKYKEEKKKIIANLDWYKTLSVEELTFRMKWEEVQSYTEVLTDSRKIKAMIWAPTDLSDEKKTIKEIESVCPSIVVVDAKESADNNRIWNTLRIYCHSADYNQAPGRLVRYLIYDETTEKIIGFTSIASDVPAMECRDSVIGWDRETKLYSGRLNNSAIATTIAPTQPFGTNFLGGKLIAALMTCPCVRNAWKDIYGDILVGMTTTSLYGSYSMYNGLKWWKDVGSTKGEIAIKPTEEEFRKWVGWLKQYRKEDYDKATVQKEGVSGPVTGPKLRIIELLFKELGIKASDYKHGHERGVYYSFFYENTKDFLCNKIGEQELKPKQLTIDGLKAILEYWTPRAIARYKKLKQENRLNPEKLFYNQMVGMSYEEAKAKYFRDVGR